jgi:hypothetical protein
MSQDTFEYLRTVSDQDGGVILDLRHGTLSLLNTTAAYVWERFRDGVEPIEIVRQLAELTDTPKEIVATDVFAFLKQLRATHLDCEQVMQ